MPLAHHRHHHRHHAHRPWSLRHRRCGSGNGRVGEAPTQTRGRGQLRSLAGFGQKAVGGGPSRRGSTVTGGWQWTTTAVRLDDALQPPLQLRGGVRPMMSPTG